MRIGREHQSGEAAASPREEPQSFREPSVAALEKRIGVQERELRELREHVGDLVARLDRMGVQMANQTRLLTQMGFKKYALDKYSIS